MPDIIIPRGGPRDGWIWTSVNGVQTWIRAGERTTVSDSIAEILDHAGLNYIVEASGDFTATSVIDPVNGAYTFNGAAVALGDIIDVTTESFNPANDMDAGGIKLNTDDGNFGGRSMPFIGDLLDSLLGGFTIVFEVYTGQAINLAIEFHDPVASYTGYNNYTANTVDHQYTRNLTSLDQTSVDYFTDTDSGPGDNVATVSADSIAKVAMTFATDRVSQSVGGESAVTIPNAGSAPTGDFISFDMGGSILDTTPRIRKFTVYAPVDDADLPALSAP